ncbi:MAG: hypothetical protein V4542_02195 [Pseudomonadota bacterium]
MKKALSPVKDSAVKIALASDRLLAGKPIHSKSYALNATNLALEAGVGRATLNRAPELRDAFMAEVAALRAKTSAEHPEIVAKRLQEELTQLKTSHSLAMNAANEKISVLGNEVQLLYMLLQECRKHKGAKILPMTTGAP